MHGSLYSVYSVLHTPYFVSHSLCEMLSLYARILRPDCTESSVSSCRISTALLHSTPLLCSTLPLRYDHSSPMSIHYPPPSLHLRVLHHVHPLHPLHPSTSSMSTHRHLRPESSVVITLVITQYTQYSVVIRLLITLAITRVLLMILATHSAVTLLIVLYSVLSISIRRTDSLPSHCQL